MNLLQQETIPVPESAHEPEPEPENIIDLIGRTEAEATPEESRPKVRLPAGDSELIPFFTRLGEALSGDLSNIFQKNDRLFAAECVSFEGKEKARLRAPTATSLCEDVERNVILVKVSVKKTTCGGIEVVDGKIKPKEATLEVEEVERKVSLPDKLAKKALESFSLKSSLREIRTVEQVLLPVIGACGKLVKLKKGYDANAKVFSADSTSYVTNMPLLEAIKVIEDWFGQFDFGDDGRSKAVLIAFMVSEFVRYLMPLDVLRPICINQCNAPGGGKTIGLQMSMGPVHGLASVMSYPGNKEELEKKVAASFEGGKRLLIFDNVEGYCNSDVICQVVTSPKWGKRTLGILSNTEYDHASQVMISGNNIRIGADLARRSLICDLRQTAERPELRVVKNPFCGTMLESNRPKLLAALWSLTANWINEGKPDGKTILGSFVDWSKIVGGIVIAAGFADPCQVVSVADIDADGNDARTLVTALANGLNPGDMPAIDAKSGLTPQVIREWMVKEELFENHIGGTKSIGSIASIAGKILTTWANRDCAGYRLKHNTNTNNSRRKYWVEKIGESTVQEKVATLSPNKNAR
jgi:hypothetical protein